MSHHASTLSHAVHRASKEPARLNSLSDQLVPVMMFISREEVTAYIKELRPLLNTLQKGTEEYAYLIIILSCLYFREARYTEIVQMLQSYEIEYEHTLTDNMFVSMYCMIGTSYRSLGQTEFALEYLQRNILFTQIDRPCYTHLYSVTLYHIAELYGELDEYEAMRDRHELNLNYFQSKGIVEFYFRSMNGLAKAYQYLRDYDNAIRFLTEAEARHSELNNFSFRARNLHDMGVLYAELNMVDKSLEYFKKAHYIRKKHNLVDASISTTMEVGRILIDNDSLAQAISLLTKSLDTAKQIGVKKKQFEICRLLAEAYEKNNDLKNALDYYKKFYTIKSSVDNVHYTQAENQRMREVNTVLEEQKNIIEEQNIKIAESNEAIRTLNENLEALVNERTRQLMDRQEQLKRYAFMNAHEVRGPLSSILGLIQIEDEFSTPEEKEEFIEMIKQSTLKLDRTIRKMHKELIKFTTNPENI